LPRRCGDSLPRQGGVTVVSTAPWLVRRTPRHLAILLAVLLATLVTAGVHAPASIAAAGIQVSINGAPSVFVSAAEVGENVDVEPQPGQLPAVGVPGGVVSESGEPGMSAKLLAELAGVAPSYTLNTMTITGQAGAVSLDRSGVVSGFTDEPYESVPYYAVFGSNTAVGGPYDGKTEMIFGAPVFSPPGQYGAVYYPDGAVSFPGASASPDNGTLLVDLANSGIVLGVPEPAFDVCTPGVDQTVGFALPAGAAVSLGQQSGAPADTNGLTYSWDFGDGTSPTPLSSSASTPHAFAAQGTFAVRLTVVDAGGNAGVSTAAALVSVGATPGAPGACGQLPGGGPASDGHNAARPGAPPARGGTPTTGGGNGAPNTLSSGAATGSVHALTSHVAPRKTGAAAAPTSSSTPTPSSGSSPSGAGGGSGRGGSGRGRAGGGGRGSTGSGAGTTGRPGGRSAVSGSAASAASTPGAGAGRTKSPKRLPVAGTAAPPGLTGVVIDASGAPLSGGLPSAASNALSLLQSVARSSAGSGGSGGLPGWLLGIVSLVALVVLGVVREAGPGLAGGRRVRRSGAGSGSGSGGDAGGRRMIVPMARG
jgi:uncharacterized membrane protein YgcG